MALIDSAAGLVVTAAPGTGSTALRAALVVHRDVTEVPTLDSVRVAGLDAKHATVRELVAKGLLTADHGLRIVTTTRNPFDFYLAEYERTRTRWSRELADPLSWVFSTPGALDRIADATSLTFPAWLERVLGLPPGPRRVNRGHVEEADVILRMERLEEDARNLLDLTLVVPYTNVTQRDRDWRRSYQPTSRRLVVDSHQEDLDRFGYRF